MRKIISTLLTLIFVLYLGGVQVMYWVKMSTCKQQVQTLIHGHKLSRKNTIDFSFTPSEYSALSWSEENKEFNYKGQRYDIMAMQFYSDKILITCYSDDNESILVEAFSGFIKKMFSSSQQNNNSNNDIASNIYKEYIPAESPVPLFFSRVLISIEAKCVLVDVSAKIDAIWHPPTLA
jgi:hypothetical protein